MTDNDNLGQRVDSYLRRYIGTSRDYTMVIFKSCLQMLPEAQTIGCLVNKCVESLISFGDGVVSCIEEIKMLKPKNFQIVAESLSCRLMGNNDILYRIIDLYLKENGGKMAKDEKTRLCNCIDCTKLSQNLQIHTVQNPKMPLPFIVQAMFVDQLHTRRSISTAAATSRRQKTATLGGILERDAVLRRSSQLRASMDATCTKIKGLEKELEGMKKILVETGSGRSVSSQFEMGSRVERGQRGSVSSSSSRGVLERGGVGGDSCSLGSNNEKGFGRKLVERVKNVFAMKKKIEKV